MKRLKVHRDGRPQAILDELEDRHAAELHRQKERSEKGFREGKFTTWEDLKWKAGL